MTLCLSALRLYGSDVEYDGDITGIGLYHKYRGTKLEKVHEGVLDIFTKTWPIIMQETVSKGEKLINPELFMRTAIEKYGRAGLDMVMERLDVMDKALNLSPHSGQRYTEWNNIESLFNGGARSPEAGKFIDQRFINYLYANHDKLQNIHWRKFEELTAEYFQRHGYKVELGPGTNDDGGRCKSMEI